MKSVSRPFKVEKARLRSHGNAHEKGCLPFPAAIAFTVAGAAISSFLIQILPAICCQYELAHRPKSQLQITACVVMAEIEQNPGGSVGFLRVVNLPDLHRL
jgi:hypothetical protein